MLPQFGPITQTILGTLFTWGLTAAGAGLVVIIHGKQVSVYFLCSLLYDMAPGLFLFFLLCIES